MNIMASTGYKVVKNTFHINPGVADVIFEFTIIDPDSCVLISDKFLI